MTNVLETAKHTQLTLLAHELSSDPSTHQLQITHEGMLPTSPHEWLYSNEYHGVFNEQGEWILPPSEENPFEMTPETADVHMRETLRPVYEAAQDSLGHVNWFGYNDHGPVHIDAVTARAKGLLELAGATPETVLRGVIAARAHDLGNLVSRDIHSMISPEILTRIYPALAEDHESWETVSRAIMLHDSAIYKDFRKGIANLEFGQKTEAMLELYGMEGLALILADKTDIGKHRVNQKARNQEAINTHVHSEMDLLMTTTEVAPNEDQTDFTWQLTYDPMINLDDHPDFTDLVDPKSVTGSIGKIRGSEYTQERAHGKYPMPAFETMSAKILSNHIDRIELAMISAFALFPNLQTFRMQFVDPFSRSTREIIISPDTFAAQLHYLTETYARKR